MDNAHGNRPTSYVVIFWWLGILTVLEIGAASLGIPTGAKGALLVSMALGKAALVALYFMHLRFETRTLSLIAITPLVLCVFLLLMLMPDTGWVWRPPSLH